MTNNNTNKTLKRFKIIYKPLNEKRSFFYTDKYDVIDSGHSIQFYYEKHDESKVFPYLLCEVKPQILDKLENSEL